MKKGKNGFYVITQNKKENFIFLGGNFSFLMKKVGL